MTHNHYNHNAIYVVRRMHDDVLMREDVFKARGLKVKKINTWHDAVQGAKCSSNVIYLFEMNEIAVCHYGNLSAVSSREVLDRICNVDMLFVPTEETFTMPLP